MKLALSRAILRKADILLLDEPTNHLDVPQEGRPYSLRVRWLNVSPSLSFTLSLSPFISPRTALRTARTAHGAHAAPHVLNTAKAPVSLVKTDAKAVAASATQILAEPLCPASTGDLPTSTACAPR